MEIITFEEMSGEELTEMGWGGDSHGNEFKIGVTYMVEINHSKKKILSIIPKGKVKDDAAEFQYKNIMDWGVISWYNFNGRIGNWYEPMDGPEEIKAIMGYFEESEDYERAKEMKEKLDELKEYMIKEEMWSDESDTSK